MVDLEKTEPFFSQKLAGQKQSTLSQSSHFQIINQNALPRPVSW